MISDFVIVVLTDHQRKNRSLDRRSSSRQSGGAFRRGPEGERAAGDRVLCIPRSASRRFRGETFVGTPCFAAISGRFL
jgi:hypothetical protein